MKDEELRQALTLLDVYNSQLEAFSQQAQIFRASLEEALRARETMKAFRDAKEGDEILVPIGASSFVFAKASGNGKAIVGIGSRVSVEKDLGSAVEFMDATAKDISEALKKTSESAAETEAGARNLSLEIQQEYQRRQQ
jgi:prefoldin alpha subunit